MSRVATWITQHRLITFFVLAYAVSWLGWLLYLAGGFPSRCSCRAAHSSPPSW